MTSTDKDKAADRNAGALSDDPGDPGHPGDERDSSSAGRGRRRRNMRSVIEAEAHHKFAVSLVLAGMTCWLTHRHVSLPVSLILTWDAFALCSLALAWLGMLLTDPRRRAREARLLDSGYTAIALCMALASVAGLAASGLLLTTAKGRPEEEATLLVMLAAGTIVISWVLMHTMLAVHYAHIYYSSRMEEGGPFGTGLEFPGGEKNPDFLDFAYFSFVIGMTFQVSDVQITARRIRRVALLHGLLSFAFNTVILAFSVNLAASMM